MDDVGADGQVPPARFVTTGPERDEVSDAWMLAVVDEAKAHGQERLHAWLMSDAALHALSAPDRHDSAPRPTGASAVAVAWFEPVAAALVRTLDGRQCEAHVESAAMLGLPRWSPGTAPPDIRTWAVRLHPMGLALHDPTGQSFARGVTDVAPVWTTTAIDQGRVLAVYGVGPQPVDGRAVTHPTDRLTSAQDAAAIAAAWVPFVY
ncbi:hypothetical protein [Micromonospora sp. URMC 103]|uniref:hypothetical protein n=1 Tax=Micromonospora sp. URMC 103 TaxID=3423406 RepID=UPI003F1CEF20